ncbi:unnamed protein product [Mytilus edulis]|uniref:Integrase zinc-binding domain-containing protein n=1 Tax=Mytilus edulis TaxID=6550 RepID=A0A8S3RD16_MYTED|nr:unnamed protein product [Mytilus edulis]
MARTLVKASETVPLRFMNVSNVVKIIRAGTIVGNISPIQDVISDDKNITDIHKDQNLRIELQKLLSNCSENLSQEQKRGVENLLNEYKDLFAASDRDLGRTNLVRHTINTGNNAPVKQPPRRTPIHMREEVDRHIDDMLERGVIEPADGPWSSGIVLVKKRMVLHAFALIIASVDIALIGRHNNLYRQCHSKPDECERDKEDDTEISLKHLQDNDKNLQIVRQWVQDGHKPNLKNLGEYNYVIKSLWSQFDDLKIQDGVLCKVHRDNNKSRVIVPLTERRRILQQCHDNKTSGHLGIKKTQSRIKDRFYWPGVRHDIVAYIAGCEICAKRKGPNKRQRAPMQSAQHETTGCTPNRMMLGREVATPVDLMYEVPDYLKKIPQNRWAWEL